MKISDVGIEDPDVPDTVTCICTNTWSEQGRALLATRLPRFPVAVIDASA